MCLISIFNSLDITMCSLKEGEITTLRNISCFKETLNKGFKQILVLKHSNLSLQVDTQEEV